MTCRNIGFFVCFNAPGFYLLKFPSRHTPTENKNATAFEDQTINLFLFENLRDLRYCNQR